MLGSRHDLHVAAFASGAWNDDFVRHFIGRGIGYNLSLAVRSHSMSLCCVRSVPLDCFFLSGLKNT